MSFGFGFGLPSWQALSGGFTLASLFSAGEQGAWYDPSDLTTLFTDSAGTTPVTAVEQFVGLMLDKSKGLVLGPELVTNGDFSNGTTGWSADRSGSLSVVSNALRVTQGAVADYAVGYQAVTLVIGQWYKLTVDFVGGTATNVQVGVGTSSSSADATFLATATSPRTLTVYFAATAATMYVRGSVNVTTDNVYADFDNFSLKALPGNHATSTGTKRPKLAARYNLLTYSEQFDNGAWTKDSCTISANATTAPDGTLTADKIVSAAATAATGVSQVITASAAAHTASYYVKAAEATFVQLLWSGARSAEWVNFNLLTGSISGGSYTSASITAAANGFWRITLTSTFSSAGSAPSFLWLIDNGSAGRASSYTGNGANGLFVWGADLRPTSQATGLIGPTYQRVAAATDYDTVGFLPYLAFDGVDDSMSTGSIDFTTTDKMTVWAGVRKLSDAAIGTVTELGTSFNGSFSVFAPLPLGPNYGFGTTSSPSVYQTGYAAVAAPSTDVLQGSYDLSQATLANQIKARINAVAKTLTFTGAGTPSGNFMNGGLFIGSRAGTSFFFNGWLSSLIIRGAQSTQSQIEATESWVNGKTGAF